MKFVKTASKLVQITNLKNSVMKKVKILAMTILAISFGACSSDDDSSNNNMGSIAGRYNLTEFNTGAATDFNQDGTASTNQMDESSCYDARRIDFNSDNTFTYDMDYILIDTSTGVAVCADNTVSGTWTATNSVITATYEQENGTEVTLNFVRSNNGRTLTQTTTLTTYPDRNSEGVAYNRVGSVTTVFTKQ